jgi:CDGSH-type Zn-finger protein
MLVRGLELRRIAGLELGADLAPGPSYAVCRCGRSSAMPFCDRQTPYGCFDEEPPTHELDKPPVWDVPDPAVPCVALKANGPIRVAGEVPVEGADGTPVPAYDGRRSFCRCGVSACQPMCDGSHKLSPIADP